MKVVQMGVARLMTSWEGKYGGWGLLFKYLTTLFNQQDGLSNR